MRRLFFIALLASGCGFLGAPAFTETDPPSVAPWQDVGPVLFCDGAQRIGIVSAGPLGTCATQPGPAATCASDGDCGSREACLCGACVRPVCDTADECPSGRVCTFVERVCDRACDADSDCASGESCVPGQHVCRGTCGQTSDCQSGERCDLASGLCKPVTCADATTCGGRSCDVQRIPASLAHPFARVDGDQVLLWLDRDGAPAFASSSDGYVFQLGPGDPRPDQGLLVQNGSLYRAPDQLLLTPDQVTSDLWKGVDALDAPFLDDQGRLWFAGHGTEAGPSYMFGTATPTPPNWAIGEASSVDGINFVAYPFNPVFTRTLDFTNHPSELDPAVVTFGGESLLYYRRASPDGTKSENLAVARNPPK
jgi:hypothetical protein